MTTINYTPGTKVWVRLEGQKKLAVFKGPVPSLWGGGPFTASPWGRRKSRWILTAS